MKKTIFSLVAAGTLVLLACQGNTVGIGCTIDKDCDRGQTCFLDGFPGGFCTKGCAQLGQSIDCPMGMVCTSITPAADGGSRPVFFCSPPCTDDAQCRGGQYLCRPITNTDRKACAP